MKRLFITIALITSIVQLNMRADSLLYAIDTYNVDKVEALLAKHTHLHHEYKKSLMRAAKQSAHAAKAKVGFFSSGTDFLKLITGMGLAGTGGAGLGVSGAWLWWNDLDSTPGSNMLAAGSGVTALGGLVLIYKGLTLSTAKARLERAREIEGMIALKSVHH